MQIPPASVILSWPSPNYHDPETRGHALLVLMIIFSIFMTAAALGRFYSRIYLNRWFGLDDGMMVLALIFALGMNASVILANQNYGWNRHVWDLKFDMFQKANIVAFAAKLLFVAAASFTRMSLICFYYRLVRDSGIDWFTWVLHASMFFVVSLGISFTFVGIFLCVPVQSYWIFPPMAKYKCLDEGTTTLIIGILNCIADLLTTVLPIPLIMRLQMPLKHRIGVCVLLGLGIIVTAAGIIRTYYIWASLIHSWDETWLSYPLWICAAIEIDLSVICACAPALKPLLHGPLTRFSTRISTKVASLRSPNASRNNTSHTSSSGTNSRADSKFSGVRHHFRKSSHPLRTGETTIWDGDEEYGMLRLPSELEKPSVTISSSSNASRSAGEGWNRGGRPGGPARKTTLEIMKRQSVDQEIEYLSPEEAEIEGRQHRAPPPLEPIDFR